MDETPGAGRGTTVALSTSGIVALAFLVGSTQNGEIREAVSTQA
ncbi:MAG TPA: hypothetical protein VH087_03355 [Thermoanaerobaculia bacterium]|jgi:hypothetical protein|nr:hypothetical protein [Thermoanaerobaculia bacterium]